MLVARSTVRKFTAPNHDKIDLIVESFYSVNYVNITVDCKYVLFLQDFFFKLKPRQYKNANIAGLKKNIWKLIKQNKLTVESFDEKPSEK